MAKFEVTYADGTVKVEEQSDCHTLEQFINCRFGTGGLPDKIVHLDEVIEEKPAEEKPAEEKPAEEKPAEEKPAEEKPAEEKPAEEKPKKHK